MNGMMTFTEIIITFRRSLNSMVKGHIEGKRRLRRIICGFEQDTFDHIVRVAETAGVSVSEVIRTYVEWGMESEQND
jgi:hypothetical protein|tara:strand:+ start:378 stop:608 length:231 start_codon:yes stop_codon:yes gene_type:complete